MPAKLQIIIVGVAVGGLYILYLVIRSVQVNARTQQWTPARAHALGVQLAPTGDTGDAALYAVHARLRTTDGSEITGWALGAYNWHARHWVGHEVDAWYDPADPARFMLHPPDSSPLSVLKGALALVPIVVFLALLAVIYYLES